MRGLIIFAVVMAAIIFFVSKFIKSRGVKASIYLIFAIVDIVAGLLVLGFALIDFKVSVGEFAGIFGQLALMICEPIVGILLVIDIIVWLINKKKS